MIVISGHYVSHSFCLFTYTRFVFWSREQIQPSSIHDFASINLKLYEK